MQMLTNPGSMILTQGQNLTLVNFNCDFIWETGTHMYPYKLPNISFVSGLNEKDWMQISILV